MPQAREAPDLASPEAAVAGLRQLGKAEIEAICAPISMSSRRPSAPSSASFSALTSPPAKDETELPPGVGRQRAYRLRAYVLAIRDALRTSPQRLEEILNNSEKAVEVAERFRKVSDRAEPIIQILWNFLTSAGPPPV